MKSKHYYFGDPAEVEELTNDCEYIQINSIEEAPTDFINLNFKVLLTLARYGQTDATLAIIRMIAKRRKVGAPLPEAVDKWLTNALLRIAEGENPNKAFGITAKRRGPKKKKRSPLEEFKIACQVHEIAKRGAPLVDNSEQEGAFTIVGQRYGLGETAVKQIYYKHLALMKQAEPGDLLFFPVMVGDNFI